MKEIIETIMSIHWDMEACNCWVCIEGRKLKCYPRPIYLKTDRKMVTIEQEDIVHEQE